MSAMANIVVYDDALVAHTLIPVSVTRVGGKVQAAWRENVTAVPVDAQTKSFAEIEQLPKSGVYKVTIKTVVPVMETIGASSSTGYTAKPKVAHELTGITTYLFSNRSTAAERQFLHAVHQNFGSGRTTSLALITSAIISEMVQLLNAPY